MAKLFKKEIVERGKVVYKPWIEDLYGANSSSLNKLLGQMLDDVAEDYKNFPYMEREYVLTTNEESIPVLQRAFKDHKAKLELGKSYESKIYRICSLGGLAGGFGLYFLTGISQFLWLLIILGVFLGKSGGGVVQELYDRKRKRRLEAAKLLQIGESP